MQNVANPGFYCYLQLCNGTPEEHNGSHNTFAAEADTQERQSREHVNECYKAIDGYIVNNQRITTLKATKMFGILETVFIFVKIKEIKTLFKIL